VIAEIQCLPSPAGTSENHYAHVDAAIAVIAGSGLRYEVGPLGTSFEGAPDMVWSVLRVAHEACLAAGAESVVTVVKVYEGQAEGTDTGAAIDDLISRHRT
jgi:uncharacterized protein YqgV (UPF0045/DUF77 family)